MSEETTYSFFVNGNEVSSGLTREDALNVVFATCFELRFDKWQAAELSNGDKFVIKLDQWHPKLDSCMTGETLDKWFGGGELMESRGSGFVPELDPGETYGDARRRGTFSFLINGETILSGMTYDDVVQIVLVIGMCFYDGGDTWQGLELGNKDRFLIKQEKWDPFDDGYSIEEYQSWFGKPSTVWRRVLSRVLSPIGCTL